MDPHRIQFGSKWLAIRTRTGMIFASDRKRFAPTPTMTSFFTAARTSSDLSTEILEAEYGALCNQVQNLTVQSLRDRAASAALVIRAELLSRDDLLPRVSVLIVWKSRNGQANRPQPWQIMPELQATLQRP